MLNYDKVSFPSTVLMAFLVATGLLWANPGAGMAGVLDCFLSMDSVEGESTDARHQRAIDIVSFSWEESQSGAVPFGGGGGVGRVQMKDFQFTKYVDKASPQLMLFTANGHHVPRAILTCRKKTGLTQPDFLKVTMFDVLVSSYQTGIGSEQAAAPLDRVSLNFAKIELEYSAQRPDGSLAGSIKAEWDVKRNLGGLGAR